MTMSVQSSGQNNQRLDIGSGFCALIVEDIVKSTDWYKECFEFDVLNSVTNTERGFSQANLARLGYNLELIQLNNAVNPADAIPDYNSRTRLIGMFKFGFTVKSFDSWLTKLEGLDAVFHGEVVSDPKTGKRMIILLDPDGNRIQLFEE